jgi:hypothetical protein
MFGLNDASLPLSSSSYAVTVHPGKVGYDLSKPNCMGLVIIFNKNSSGRSEKFVRSQIGTSLFGHPYI